MTESEFKSLTEDDRWNMPPMVPPTVPCDVWLRNRKKATWVGKMPLLGAYEDEDGSINVQSAWTLEGKRTHEKTWSSYDIVAVRKEAPPPLLGGEIFFVTPLGVYPLVGGNSDEAVKARQMLQLTDLPDLQPGEEILL